MVFQGVLIACMVYQKVTSGSDESRVRRADAFLWHVK